MFRHAVLRKRPRRWLWLLFGAVAGLWIVFSPKAYAVGVDFVCQFGTWASDSTSGLCDKYSLSVNKDGTMLYYSSQGFSVLQAAKNAIDGVKNSVDVGNSTANAVNTVLQTLKNNDLASRMCATIPDGNGIIARLTSAGAVDATGGNCPTGLLPIEMQSLLGIMNLVNGTYASLACVTPEGVWGTVGPWVNATWQGPVSKGYSSCPSGYLPAGVQSVQVLNRMVDEIKKIPGGSASMSGVESKLDSLIKIMQDTQSLTVNCIDDNGNSVVQVAGQCPSGSFSVQRGQLNGINKIASKLDPVPVDTHQQGGSIPSQVFVSSLSGLQSAITSADPNGCQLDAKSVVAPSGGLASVELDINMCPSPEIQAMAASTKNFAGVAIVALTAVACAGKLLAAFGLVGEQSNGG